MADRDQITPLSLQPPPCLLVKPTRLLPRALLLYAFRALYTCLVHSAWGWLRDS